MIHAAIITVLSVSMAIIIRHDRPDSRYLELGAAHPAVVRVGQRGGDGTLIGDRWVLTAAHVANGIRHRAESVVLIGGRSLRFRQVYLHPRWREMSPDDIALIELVDAVRDVAPVGLYRWRDEAGRVAVLVGHGRTGTGVGRARRDDDLKRGATNRIEAATDALLTFTFDAPPAGTDLEGIPGAGDSGGPALLERDGRWFVAGVSHAGEPGGEGPGSYGARDHFVRVSTHVAWIDRVLAGQVVPTPLNANAVGDAGQVVTIGGAPGSTQIPNSPAGRRIRALVALFQSGDSAAIAGFVRAQVRSAGQGSQGQTDAVQRYQRLLAEFRQVQVVGVLLDRPQQVDLLVRTPAGERILGVQVEDGGEGRITGVLTGRP